jgi:hypothetical protein
VLPQYTEEELAGLKTADYDCRLRVEEAKP